MVDSIQPAERSVVFQIVVHEVHGPSLVVTTEYRQCLLRALYKMFARMDLKVQLLLRVDATYSLVVPLEAFHISQTWDAKPEPQLTWLSVSRTSQSSIRRSLEFSWLQLLREARLGTGRQLG